MGDKSKRREEIPPEIISRYSKVETLGDIVDLEHTGYLPAMHEGGLLDNTTKTLLNNFRIPDQLIQLADSYGNYRIAGAGYKIPSEFVVANWETLSASVGKVLKTSELSTVACPFLGKAAATTRAKIEQDIIKVIKSEDLEIYGKYPSGIYHPSDFKTATYAQLADLKISYQTYLAAIEKDVLPDSHREYARLWESHIKHNLANPQKPLPVPTTTEPPTKAKNIQGKYFELFTQAISVFKDRYPDQWVTDTSVWANLPELCPALVLSIQGKGEASQAIMKHDKPWKWRAFKSAFQRHQKTHGDT